MADLAERISGLLHPQPMEREEREQRARHLRVTVLLALPALALGAVLNAAQGYSRAAIALALAAAPVLVAHELARRNRVNVSAAVVLGTLLALATWLLHEGDGLQDIAILFYPMLVLVGSMLLERRPFVVLVAGAAASLAWISWGQATGSVRLVSEALRPGLLLNLASAIIIVVIAAVATHVLVVDLRRTLRQARQGERALAQSEERYRLISQVISDYTFSSVVDDDGRVRQVWVAGAFERITGFTFPEYLERGGWHAALHPGDKERDDRDLETLRANRPVVSELRTLTKSGDVRWVRIYAHPVFDQARGRLTGIYGAVQDVTDRKHAEADREALIRELESKNAELERFTYTASHDLKSPLVTVRGFLAFLERDALEGNHERLRADIERIREATGKMQRLLDELLELSRVGRVMQTPGPVPGAELAREAVALLQGAIAARQVEVKIADDLPTLWGDRTRLLQVVQNLVDNAVKFLGDQPEPRVEIGGHHDGANVTIWVKDNGIGIDPRHAQRVFGLFDKLDPESEGTGVGLALVHRILELHGGSVRVESAGPGHGTSVSFTLPGGPPSGIG